MDAQCQTVPSTFPHLYFTEKHSYSVRLPCTHFSLYHIQYIYSVSGTLTNTVGECAGKCELLLICNCHMPNGHTAPWWLVCVHACTLAVHLYVSVTLCTCANGCLRLGYPVSGASMPDHIAHVVSCFQTWVAIYHCVDVRMHFTFINDTTKFYCSLR